MNSSQWEKAAECLRVLAHPHRLQILHLLLEREHSVKEISEVLSLLQNVTSEHLSQLKGKEWLQSRRCGKNVYYSVRDTSLSPLFSCIRQRYATNETHSI